MATQTPVLSIEGHYRDRLIAPDGTIIRDSGWTKNLIVLRCRILLAGFLRNDTALGIQALQVGRGDASWDTTSPPLADAATTVALVDLAPFSIPASKLTFQYLNDTEGVVGPPTNRVQITATLGHNEPTAAVFPLREFGLFGQLGGTPFMIDYIRHPLYEKDPAVTLERRVRLVL